MYELVSSSSIKRPYVVQPMYNSRMLKRLNLLGMYVSDLSSSVEFYRRLGFETTEGAKDNREAAYVQLGDFKLQFIAKSSATNKPAPFQKDAFGEPKGTGLYINIQVEDVDELYQNLKIQGIETSSQPIDWPWGHREFVLRDPDGYKLVLYQEIG